MIDNILSLLDGPNAAGEARTGRVAEWLSAGGEGDAPEAFIELFEQLLAGDPGQLGPEQLERLQALLDGKDLPPDGKEAFLADLLKQVVGPETANSVLPAQALAATSTQSTGPSESPQGQHDLSRALRQLLGQRAGGEASRLPTAVSAEVSAAGRGAEAYSEPLLMRPEMRPGDQGAVLPDAWRGLFERMGPLQRMEPLSDGHLMQSGGRETTDGGSKSAEARLIQPVPPQQLAALTSTAAQTGETSSMNRLPPMQMPVGGPNWSNALGQRVIMMAGQGMDRAEVKLHPPHLGPLEIRIAVHQDQASLTLSSQHPLTRDALEQALPRLREMLEDRGLEMTDANVSDGRERQDERLADGRARAGAGEEGPLGHRPEDEQAQEIRIGLLDEYA